MSKLTESIDGPEGFSTALSFTDDELTMVKSLIRNQWLKRIEEFNFDVVNQFKNISISDYHKLAHLVDHANMWSKSKRILSKNDVLLIRQTSLIKNLEMHFGEFIISGEDGVEDEEIYWRLVRPDCQNDVGPFHADEWFWSLGHGVTPPGRKRVKVWISIFSEPGMNGFGYLSGSHKKDWKYHGVLKNGILKPQIDEDIDMLEIDIFKANPGQSIVFHDKLLHGGVVGGSTTRVSLEFTMFVVENYESV